jgi:zinc transporter
LPGLVCAFRFHPDGSCVELDVEKPITESGGWLWLHFNASDTRACRVLGLTLDLPPPARATLISADEHQQLHGYGSCVHGVLADLVCGLDGVTEEIGFLHLAVCENLFVSTRRRQLNAVEATRRALRKGLKVGSPPALLETIAGQIIEALDAYAEQLAERLDRVEERLLADTGGADRLAVVSVRRMTVRLHRQLVILSSLIHRFEHGIEQGPASKLVLQTARLAQRLDWLDTEILELRDRSRLLQEEIMLKDTEQTNRSLHVLATVTTVFLPASLVAALFGMNVGGLPLTKDGGGFLWAMGIIALASALVYWLLKRSGTVGR